MADEKSRPLTLGVDLGKEMGCPDPGTVVAPEGWSDDDLVTEHWEEPTLLGPEPQQHAPSPDYSIPEPALLAAAGVTCPHCGGHIQAALDVKLLPR